MTQEEKDLLLKDLSARLSYFELKVQYKGEDFNIIDIGFGRVTLVKPFMSITNGSPLIEEIKPYLRPMSSMTEEECKEFACKILQQPDLRVVKNYKTLDISFTDLDKVMNWLNSHHFDYRGLIEKGLALEAPEGMYKTKTE